MKKWKLPPKIKVLEALGAIADGRIKLEKNSARVTSSKGDKSYTVKFDLQKNYIFSNDAGSRFQGYLGYPSIAVLMLKQKLPFDPKLSQALKGIPWKEWNDKFKSYDRTIGEVKKRTGLGKEIDEFCKKVLSAVESSGFWH